MPINDTRLIGKMLGQIYNELFQRRSGGNISPVKLTNIQDDFVGISEKNHNVLIATSAVWKWGPSGNSPETNVSPLQGVWGEGVYG